jgi:hypothetical protein
LWCGRYCNEIARHALEVLQIATLVPECRRALLDGVETAAVGQPVGIAMVLEAAHGQTYLNDGEVRILPFKFCMHVIAFWWSSSIFSSLPPKSWILRGK